MMLPRDLMEDEDDDDPGFPWGPVIMMVTIFVVAALMEHFNWYPGL